MPLSVHVLGLLAYEYMITFDREVNLFWRQKITMASILFGINRYLPLAVTIINLPYSVPNISFLVSPVPESLPLNAH